jgi:hypothetical protein
LHHFQLRDAQLKMVQDKRVSAPLRGAETRLLRKVQDLSYPSSNTLRSFDESIVDATSTDPLVPKSEVKNSAEALSSTSIPQQVVTTQPMWWRATRATTLFSRCSPREAQTATAVFIEPE